MAIRRLTRNDGIDPIDGSEQNAVRRRALALLDLTHDDLSDAEMFAQQSDEYWYVDLCLEQLHRLPSEVDRILLCREYTALQAYQVVKRAIHDMQTLFRE